MPEVVLLTTNDVAKRFRVHPASVRRWVTEGHLKPTIKTPGGVMRFSEEDIETFIIEQAAS